MIRAYVLKNHDNPDNQQAVFKCPACNTFHQPRIAGYNGDIWTWNEDTEKPTFKPSILVTMPGHPSKERCHSYVTDGKIRFLDDCTHHLKGQTVDLPDIEGIFDWEEETGEKEEE